MTPAEIYQTARNAGFPPDTAVTMTAIALRESGGNPAAYNGNSATGDSSYGLWQINMIGSLGPARMQQFGITDPSQLLDPATNAKAAYAIWAGNDANLNTAWYINQPGYAEGYQQYVPQAEAAAAQVDGSAPSWTDPFASVDLSTVGDTFSSMDTATQIGIVVGVIAIVGLAVSRW